MYNVIHLLHSQVGLLICRQTAVFHVPGRVQYKLAVCCVEMPKWETKKSLR